MLLKTWTSGSPVAFPSSFSRENRPCTWQLLKKEWFTGVPRAILSNTSRFTLVTMGRSIKWEPIPSSTTSSWLVLQTGAASFGTGDVILPWTLSKALTFMMKSLMFSGALKNLLYLRQFAKMVGLSYGTFLTIKGSGEEEHVRPDLHCKGKEQSQVSSQNNGSFLQGRPSSSDRRCQGRGRRL